MNPGTLIRTGLAFEAIWKSVQAAK